MYRFNGKARRMTLGGYPKMSLADARVELADAKKQLSYGVDPGNIIVAQNIENRESPTVADLVNIYLKEYAYREKKSAAEDERILLKDVVPNLAGLKAHAVKRTHVKAIVDNIAFKREAPIQANRTLAVIRKMFNFAISESIVESNPCSQIRMPSKENQRDRVLSDNEIGKFWLGSEECGITEPVQIALKLQLVTAQRKQEVAIARWDEIDDGDTVWTIPAINTKNGKLNRVPLSPLAVKLLLRLRSLSPNSDWLFPSRGKNLPITERAIDRAVGRHRELIGLDHFTPHDLRRTAASNMTMLGYSRFIVERILNHADQSVAAVYDRYSYDKEKREALCAWANKIEGLVP
jgi:integrase